MIIVKSDYKWKNVLSGCDLPTAQRAEFDYLNDDAFGGASFVFRRGQYYDLGEFLNGGPNGWQAHTSDSFFSGTVVNVSADGEQYQIGGCCSVGYDCATVKLDATDTKGTRIKASNGARSIVRGYDYALSAFENHKAVAIELIGPVFDNATPTERGWNWGAK